MLSVFRPAPKPVRAAARLAGVYAAGVTLSMLALVLTVGDPGPVLEGIYILGLPIGICFGVAFVLLALGRRAGFTALWLLLLALRAWVVTDLVPAPSFVFLLWSVFAAPLYGITMAGFQPVSKPNATISSSWRAALGTWSVWAMLALIAMAWLPSSSLVQPADLATRLVWTIANVGWLALPAGLSIAAIFRARRGVCFVASDA